MLQLSNIYIYIYLIFKVPTFYLIIFFIYLIFKYFTQASDLEGACLEKSKDRA